MPASRNSNSNSNARNTTDTSWKDKNSGKTKVNETNKGQNKATNGIPPSPPLSPLSDRAPKGDKIGESTKLDMSSNKSTAGATSAWSTVPPTTKNRDPTEAAVVEFFGTMRNTIGALGNTLDLLGNQSAHFAVSGPAVDAVYQIRTVQSEVEHRNKSQDDKMQELQEILQTEFRCHIRQMLRPQLNAIIADILNREVAVRVKHHLSVQIPSSLRAELREYKWRILQVKTSLHNSEARRHNALIRGSGLEEPLQPLLRPLEVPMLASSAQPDENANVGGALTEDKQKGKVKATRGDARGVLTPPHTATPLTSTSASSGTECLGLGRGADDGANRLSVNTDVRTSAGVTALQRTPTSSAGELGGWDVTVPTPSPLFPSSIATLVALGTEEVKALVREYGLARSDQDGEDDDDGQVAAVRGRAHASGGHAQVRPVSTFTNVSDAGHSWVTAGLQGSREESMNQFMRYIGVGFQVLPSSPIVTLGNGATVSFNGGGVSPGSPTVMRSPLVERPDYAFVR